MYSQYRDQIKTGDAILFSSNRSFIGWIIQKLTHSNFNHAAGVVRLEEFSGMIDRIYLAEAKFKVCFTRLSYILEKYNGSIYLVKLRSEMDPIRPYIASSYLDDLGKFYDFKGCIGNIFGRVPMDTTHLFCSELWWHGILDGYDKYRKEWGSDIKPVGSLVSNSLEYLKGRAPTPADIPNLSVVEVLINITEKDCCEKRTICSDCR